MKLKNFSDLGDVYSKLSLNNTVEQQEVITETNTDYVLNTDVTQYLNEGLNKPGQALGDGPGTTKNGSISPLAKKTGPQGLKGNNFTKVNKESDPGSNPKVMKKEEEHEEPASENEKENDAAKITTSLKKVKESAGEFNKYNYKPKFTMSKPKFDQLYEQALKRVPFTEAADNETMDDGDDLPPDDMGVPGVDDDVADMDTTPELDTGTDEVTITLPRDLAQQLHDALMGQLGGEEENIEDLEDTGMDFGGEDEDVLGDEEPEGDVAAEAIVNEPTPKEEKGNNASLQGKNNKVGDLKYAGSPREKGAPSTKTDPTPKEEKGNNSSLQGKNNKVGDLSPGKKAFE